MNTIIEDGVFSILSIFPLTRTIADEKKYIISIEQSCSSILNKYDFIKKTRICSSGCSGNKNEFYKCSCFDVVDSFLGGEKECRIYIGTTYTRWCDKPLRLDIFLKIIPKKNVGIINFNMAIDGYNAQEIISLRHVAESKPSTPMLDLSIGMKKKKMFTLKKNKSNCSSKPFKESCFSSRPNINETDSLQKETLCGLFYSLIDSIKEELPKRKCILHKSDDVLVDEIVSYEPKYKLQTIIELRSIGDFVEWNQNAHIWAEKNAQLVYGLITGDEGIDFIPFEFAKERLSNHWGSRVFFDTIAIKNNVMLLNSKTTSVTGATYMEYQKIWNEKYNGGEARLLYFKGKPCIAGFDHGILNAVERNMVIRFYYDFIDHQSKSSEKKLNKQRQKLLSFISSSLSTIDEINELYDTISRASNTDLSINRVRNRLDIQSEEMNIDYQYKNNDVIYVLTVLSLTIAVFAIQKKDNLFIGPTIFINILLVIGALIASVGISILFTLILRWIRKIRNR
ncbi:MAG: hypothetical protein J6T88_04345 [Bacteroidales bacterium]|nr:hypothetical protein [Bacteroidales bacterium]